MKINTVILALLSCFGPNKAVAAADDTSSIYMVTIHTDNFAKMKNFYQNVMELKITVENGEFVEFEHRGLRLSLASYRALSFLSAESLKVKRAGSGVGIGFKYNSKEIVERRYEELVKRGAVAISSPTAQQWGEYTAFFADPDGNVHELVSDIKQ